MIGAGVEAGDQDSGLRLAELVAAFSLATDLGLGQPMEHVLRSWLIAVRLGERLGLKAEARVALYYVMVLAWSGCVADSAEVAAWFGDDIAFRSDSYRVDLAGLPLMGLALSHAGAGTPFLHRLRLAANLVLTGGRAVERGLMSHCLTTTQMAGRLGLTAEVCVPLRQVFTRWDTKGVPDGVGGEDIARPVRLFHLAGAIASLASERLDGSGYHRGLSGAAIPATGRILAAADACHAMTEPRPHRPALPSKQAADQLRREVRSGRLVGLLFVIPTLVNMLPPIWGNDLVRWLPTSAGRAISATVGPQDPPLFSPWGQFTVFAVYTAVLLVVGGILFRKRDA